MCFPSMAQIRLPYVIEFLTHVTYTFPLNFNDTLTGEVTDSYLSFPHAQHTLATDAEFASPHPLSISPR